MSCFVKFGGQTSKNIHGVRKFCLETTLCVYACFVKFYVFVLDEIHLIGTKFLYEHVWVRNVQENIPKDHPRVLEEGPKLVPKTVQDNPTNVLKSTPTGLVDSPLVVNHRFKLISGGF